MNVLGSNTLLAKVENLTHSSPKLSTHEDFSMSFKTMRPTTTNLGRGFSTDTKLKDKLGEIENIQSIRKDLLK